MNLHQKQIKNS